jgi:3-oxoacyl-[acyl-carrier protein] reductase
MIAGHLLDEGMRVFGIARGDETFSHDAYTHIRADVADADAVAAAFRQIRSEAGGLQIAINSAGVLTSMHAMLMPPSKAREMLDVNLFGTFLVSREAAKLMKRGKWGRIVNIGSMAAALEPAGDSIYAVTKAGVATMANVLARELGPFGITCNTLAVTAIETDMLSQLPADRIRAIIESLPVARAAQPADVLNTLDFFLSEKSDYITAQTIWLGGVH